MHWTYKQPKADSDLEQGDILLPEAGLREVLRDVHPHFNDEKYLGFVIATQSCDLVRRKGEAKARYISIAIIRSLRQVLPRLFSEIAQPVTAGIFPTKAKPDARRFLERLLDQNEQALGLFYLHPDADIGLGEAAVAFLRVKVALRAEHYSVLLRARHGGLDPEFRAKFGWLVGNLYSRAATPDWSDAADGKRQVASLIDTYLQEQTPGAGPIWVEEELVEAGRAAGVLFEGRSAKELVDDLERHRPNSRIEQIADIAVTEASKLLAMTDDQRRVLRNKLTNNGPLRKLAKRNA